MSGYIGRRNRKGRDSLMTEEQDKSYMTKLLTAMNRAEASDLFISNEFPPSMKIHGTMRPMTSQKLSGEFTRRLATR